MTGVRAERGSDLLAAHLLGTQQDTSLEDETTSNFGQHKGVCGVVTGKDKW